MNKAKRVTIKLTAKQRAEVSRLTGEHLGEMMVEATKTRLGSKSAPAIKLSLRPSRIAPAIKLGAKAAPALKLSKRAAPAVKLGRRS